MTGKITLYTSHRCPWAHRAHIALAELGLEFEEVLIDLEVPREPWYLEINPRGLVPSLKYDDQILIESGIITQFLADLKESHLAPNTGTPEAALRRAKVNIFIDTFVSKVWSQQLGILGTQDPAVKLQKTQELLKSIETLIVPQLEDAAPFFGGSSAPTLAEVNTASLLLRIHAFSKPEYNLFPKELGEGLEKIPVFHRWAQAVLALPSVTGIWDEGVAAESTTKKIQQWAKEGKFK